MAEPDAKIEDLLTRAAHGEAAARAELLVRHQERLRQMIAVRLDRRLAARLDPSDVLQEVLAEACENLSDYLQERPIPFYPWLRQLAWERLAKLHRHHLRAQKRSTLREQPWQWEPSDESAQALANLLLARGSGPSGHLLREELRRRVREALTGLPERDREILVMRYLEQLSTREMAAVLGIAEGAVKTRHVRALERLRGLLGPDFSEGS